MDSETGERFRDKETGELPPLTEVNLETGEVEINCTMPRNRSSSKKFRMPSETLQSQKKTQPKRDNCFLSKNTYLPTNDVAPCILFLLPTVFCFYPIIALCVSFIEVALHVWAHKKNKRVVGKGIYYQSPLHLIAREFCGACKDERSVNKITNIQDKRNYRIIKYSIECTHGIAV